ncbi:MAG: SAM-dependent chlorinase/fluorinase [Deltaproteobacteria bacterium]|nr:SAM-dependent chlorinase/fluorinase [Deltaproteobacteria bacterium]
MDSPIITLTTDFGTMDGYVGAMKGRILSLLPQARLVDISHDIPPQSVVQGAWCLRRAAAQFPQGTIHLAVVDPGVGTSRDALVVQTRRNWLVGPDNGLLHLAAQDAGIQRIWRITPESLAASGWDEPQKSATFDGLTLFSPLAAWLARGESPAALGEPGEDMLPLEEEAPWIRGGEVLGRVLFFDRFGNAVTNISREMLEGHRVVRVELGPMAAVWGLRESTRVVEAVFCETYEDIPLAELSEPPAKKPGESWLPPEETVGALFNSDGVLELAVYSESLRDAQGLRGGEPVRVTIKPAS